MDICVDVCESAAICNCVETTILTGVLNHMCAHNLYMWLCLYIQVVAADITATTNNKGKDVTATTQRKGKSVLECARATACSRDMMICR